MAHTKAGGSTQNNRDSSPQYLGIKLYAGEVARPGMIIVRQRGNKFVAGEGVRMGKDNTLFSVSEGKIKFELKRKICFNGKKSTVHNVHVVAK